MYIFFYKLLFQVFYPFYGLFVFLLIVEILYILSDICTANIIPQCVACLFIFLMMSFDHQKSFISVNFMNQFLLLWLVHFVSYLRNFCLPLVSIFDGPQDLPEFQWLPRRTCSTPESCYTHGYSVLLPKDAD